MGPHSNSNIISLTEHGVIKTEFDRRGGGLHQFNKYLPVKRSWNKITIIESIGTDFGSFLQGKVNKKLDILKEQRNGDEVLK